MSVLILEANKTWLAQFMVPWTGAVIIDFEASEPADLYFLSDAELGQWHYGIRDFPRRTLGRMQYYETVPLAQRPFTAWHLVIANPNTIEIAVFYRVWDAPAR